jgi:hypothetical protein
MLGFYENFPGNIHRTDVFTSALSKRKLQAMLIQVLQKVNRKNLSFEEIGNPTIPNCTVIFEWGIADAEGFNYIDKEETQKILNIAAHEPFRIMDFFCAIRYYKNAAAKKTPLKFDYYMIRIGFSDNSVEFQIFHERGPRYVSPEDLVKFLVYKVNEASARKILKLVEPI